MVSDLASESVEDCSDDQEPFDEDATQRYLAELDTGVWDVIGGHHLEATYEFDNFRDALEFTYAVGELAEDEWHHPDLSLTWGEVGVELFTHEIDGLRKADFVMAAKMDEIYADHEL
ncbi:4a-hydroxytetrahydrobiopterin dehydratase [Halonotius aquaticus]|jgi:4a-hydroxytetrahydrobiopterin dehydratase|uniref:4a-hydroxytetrahydrobiopterin dehydratase n=1 Tax=Halonotius aquaticus TaxID=2216978 RepID=A0A3A6QEM9_9EURY|nr:4a-hydroxytetrahydrobiopterin dehydratase [Halonotius aquaticus]RJX45160.1 4a-hydroxytetrahydrobiopterin dehydratase [Halonotius aquaticus]